MEKTEETFVQSMLGTIKNLELDLGVWVEKLRFSVIHKKVGVFQMHA